MQVRITSYNVCYTKLLRYKLPDKFKILHISSCFPRKGADKLLEAFNSLELLNISLIIKTFPNPHNNLRDLIIDLSFKKVKEYEEDVELYRKDDKEILFINKDFSRAELKFLYENCDLFVFPSFSEGFGLPIAEAMLMNLPVITTSYGGQMDSYNFV